MYKTDVFYSLENDFKEELYAVEFSRETMALLEKQYKKSLDLLRELAQYSIAGRIKGWAIDTGTVVYEDIITPNNTKDAVVTFQEALELSAVPSNAIKATELLNESLEKYPRNPFAYDRRGFISYKMGNYKDAIIDFQKSIDIFGNNPEPHYGLGRCYTALGLLPQAIESFSTSMGASLPRESIYYTARLYLGITTFKNAENQNTKETGFAEAKEYLQGFINRKYGDSDHNNKKRYLAHKYMGKILVFEDKISQANDHFNIALTLGQQQDSSITATDIYGGSINLISEMAMISAQKASQPAKVRKPRAKKDKQ
jgi:tetratricopeptide (TPR) repeat protein